MVEGFICLGYDAVSLSSQFQMFQRNVVPSKRQRTGSQSLGISQKDRTCYPIYPRRTKSRASAFFVVNYFDFPLFKVDWCVFNKCTDLEAGR